MMISHLTTYRHPSVAEKATLLVGRRVRNQGWTRRRLESGGPEVRAGVVEGLWGLDTPDTRRTLRTCLQDASEHVVGNAVFGLHLLHEDDVPSLVEGMAADSRPGFRAVAAKLAGRIGQPEYSGLLQRARNDGDASVRLAAKQAMVEIRRRPQVPESPPVEGQPPVQTVHQPEKLLPPVVWRTAPQKPPQKRRERELRVKLDGTSTTTRWD